MKIRLAVLALAAILSTGCKPQAGTPPAPTSNTLSRASEGLSAAILGAEKSVKALRDSKQISQSETVAIQNCLAAAATADKRMNAILRAAAGADLTPAQKVEIGQVWASAALSQVVPKLSPPASSIVVGIITAANTVFATIGVPTI
jgi:hypothetical protein